MLETLSRVIIFFSFIGVGALLARLKRLTPEGLTGLTAYFYWLGFPAWLVVSFSRLPHLDPLKALDLSVYIAAMVISAGLIVLATRLTGTRKDYSVAAGFAALVSNSAFLGIPICISLFGTEVSQIGPLVVAADFLILFGIGCAGLAKASGHTIREALIHTAKNPTVIASLIGVVCMLVGFRFPPVVENTLDLMGRSGPPVALVALGGMLGLMPAQTLIRFDKTSAIAIAGKILLAPACVALALSFLHPAPLVFKLFVFLSATPTAVSVFIQTKMYGLWFEGAAKTIAQSTVISLVTLSALALILTHSG